jgi:hypothetical protein
VAVVAAGREDLLAVQQAMQHQVQLLASLAGLLGWAAALARAGPVVAVVVPVVVPAAQQTLLACVYAADAAAAASAGLVVPGWS